MDTNDWVNILYLVLLLCFIVSGVFLRKDLSLIKVLKYSLAWIAIAVFCIILYSFRFEFEDLKHRILGEINPSLAQSNSSKQIIIKMSQGNHFFANIAINGVNVRFMIDTGASDLVLSPRDARRVGIDLSDLHFNKMYQTANGKVYGASVILDYLEFGSFSMKNVKASVNSADMGTSLLGMSFLRNFQSYEFSRDQLILTP